MSQLLTARVFFVALLVVGAVALSVSFVLEPTPYDFVRDSEGHRIRLDPILHAVDYVITALRIGGVIAVVSGAYLTYRSLRPDRIEEAEGQPDHPDDRYAHVPAEGGNPGGRSGIG